MIPDSRVGVPFWAVSLSFSYLPLPPRIFCQNIWNQQLTDFDPRNSSQNLHNKELISQNLESMGVRGRPGAPLADIAASTSGERPGLSPNLSNWVAARFHCERSVSSVKVVRHKGGIFFVEGCGKLLAE